MDKRRAIEFLGYLLRDKNIERTIYEDALKIAIESLKAQLSKEDTTKDAISRQAALEKVRAMQTYKLFMGDDMILVDKAEVQTELMMLPTIQPQSTASQLNDGAQSTAQSTNLIDRQAAIDVLDKIFPADPMRNDYTQGITCGAALATEYIKQLPPAQPEVLACGNGELVAKSEPQWIPVSERLPEVHESGNSVSGIYMQSNPVLVYGTCEYEDNAQFHVVTYCDDLDGNTYWSTELDAITVSGVIAWMPLPSHYQKGTTT